MKEPSRCLPFLPDFSSSRFLANFSLSGVALCPPCTPSGYATGKLQLCWNQRNSLPRCHLRQFWVKHTRQNSSGSIKGDICPPVGGSATTCPPSQKKKWSKSAIFSKFLYFYPLRNTFCPLDAPTKKKKKKILVPPLQNGNNKILGLQIKQGGIKLFFPQEQSFSW